jgi:4-hydroxybenzoate polyprenyltransferase
MSSKKPLCVDLDHSLINTDLSVEAVIQCLKDDPLSAFKIPFWLLKGRPCLKQRLAERVRLNYDSLPLNRVVVEFAKSESTSRDIYLVTGSPQKFAEQIQGLFPFVKEVRGTHGNINLIAKEKAKYLIDKFGEKKFDYLGDSRADLKVFPHADRAYVVNNKQSYIDLVPNKEKVFPRETLTFKKFFKAIRVHQWSKNVLLFIPLLLAHAYTDSFKLLQVLLGMVSFSLTASSIYLLNDLFDLENDREHPTKRNRPLAQGSMSIPVALITWGAFFCAGLSLGALVNLNFLLLLITYMVINLLYSFQLKKVALLDVFLLAGFYTLRVGIGGLAADVPVSSWLKVFSFFLFLSLAFLKRYIELYQLFHRMGRTVAVGRGYQVQDLSYIFNLGSGSGMISVLVFCLYIHQLIGPGQENVLYQNASFLWPIAVILFYWISSVWLRGARGQVQEDPVKFALKDPQSLIMGVAAGICVLLAR